MLMCSRLNYCDHCLYYSLIPALAAFYDLCEKACGGDGEMADVNAVAVEGVD